MGAEPEAAGLPPGYPRECEQEVTLRDGRRVLIRPILPSDAPELAEAIRTADPDTLHRRFLGGAPRVTPALLAHLTVVDYLQRFALVAIDTVTRRGVAVARYEPAGEGVADIAVAVRPDWRRVGGELSSSCIWPRPRPSAASTPSAPPTWPRTIPLPPWSKTLAAWAARSSSRGSPRSRSRFPPRAPSRTLAATLRRAHRANLPGGPAA